MSTFSSAAKRERYVAKGGRNNGNIASVNFLWKGRSLPARERIAARVKLTSPIRALLRPELISESENALIAAGRALSLRLHLPATLVKFLIVGGIAFWIYQAALFVFYDTPFVPLLPARDTNLSLGLFAVPDLRLLIASILAIELAIIFQFNSHERWTFRSRRRDGWIGRRFLKFHLSSIVSPAIIVVATNGLTAATGWPPYFSAGIGVLLGFAWNWTMTTLVIWPGHRAPAAESP